MIRKNIVLAAMVCASAAVFAAEPIMRVGFITDTHVKTQKKSCDLLREALKLFKSKNVEMVVNVGDIADTYKEQAYRNYRDTVNEVYCDAQKPQEIFVYANHDIIGRKNEDVWEVFKDVKKHLQIPNDPYDVIKFKGFTFVVIPQFYNRDKYQKIMDAAVKENGNKPVFVIDHVPPANTVYDSSVWGSSRTFNIIKKYPSAIHMSGHVHGTLTNEINIWQGDFTAINVGGLAYWHGVSIGNEPSVHHSDMVIIMELYENKAVFRRFFATSKEEYQAATPWSVPLPFDKATAPYNHKRLMEKSVAPEFPANAEITVSSAKKGMHVKFTSAVHKDGIFNYEIELLKKVDGKFIPFSRQDILGDFTCSESKRPKTNGYTINWGYLDNGNEYQVKITPVHFFGKKGKPVAAEFSVNGKPQQKVVFECKDPMKELAYLSGLKNGKPFKLDADGFYVINKERVDTRLEFPANVWEGKRGTRFRFTVDIHTKQKTDSPWTMVLRNPDPVKNAINRVVSIPGDCGGMHRYVFEFVKARDAYNYYLLIREGRIGKIKFGYIKIEKL